MGTRIYVGNLPFRVGHDDLVELFSPHGEIVDAVVVSDKFSGRSKGFGFVTYSDEASTNKAIAEMNGKEIDGRALKVNEARPRDEDSSNRGFEPRESEDSNESESKESESKESEDSNESESKESEDSNESESN